MPLSILVPELVGEASSPSGSAKHSDNCDPNEPPLPAASGKAKVKQVSDAGRAYHPCTPVEEVVEALGEESEEDAVDIVELVGAHQ